ncbi:MAG TPA: DUF3179 domain-containing (seleno)protein [Puia sp.]|nr:DUF3179 domain-containing (seleno)protein [Puia sp.]
MKSKKAWLLTIGLLLLFALEILRVYFIMPFPGSQQSDTIGIAYFLDKYIVWLRILALLVVLPPLWYFIRQGRPWLKVLLTVLVLFYALIFYAFNFRFLADKMFYQPREKSFSAVATDSTDKNKLIIGVALKGEAKAYPIEIIGYHHQVKDTVGGDPVMVTYCTVCRTGRVYSPFVNGKYEQFRLVGMDHFNAMFEDLTTKSWWQQATGVAITGEMKGTKLTEIPSVQMRLGDWQALHPNSLTLRPDPNFRARYDSLKGYDEGTIEGSLERRDSGSWKFKSWVVGVDLNGRSKAYDWNGLIKERVIRDTIGQAHLLLTIEPNDKTFYAFHPADSLDLRYDPVTRLLTDTRSHSVWALNGECTDGPQKGQRLATAQAYQEFWHSWRTFHPATGQYGR